MGYERETVDEFTELGPNAGKSWFVVSVRAAYTVNFIGETLQVAVRLGAHQTVKAVGYHPIFNLYGTDGANTGT